MIIVTGNDDIDLGEYAIEKGAQDYLEKNLLTPNYLQKSLLFATRRKKQEYYLKKAIEAKNKFFSIIAHDLRSPLGNIVALSSLIESDFENMSKLLNSCLICFLFFKFTPEKRCEFNSKYVL